jgi:hypothetical protein
MVDSVIEAADRSVLRRVTEKAALCAGDEDFMIKRSFCEKTNRY